MTEEVKVVVIGEDQASKEFAKVTDSLRAIASVAQSEALKDLGREGKIAFNAIKDAANEYIDAAANLEYTNKRIDAQLALMGDSTEITAEQIKGLSDELALLGVGGAEEAQAMLLRFGDLSEEQFSRATRAMADFSALTGTGMEGAAQQIGVAIETGNWGRLTRQIGDLTAAQREALEAARLTGDQMAVQEIIITALEEKTEGAATAMADTWKGKMQIAREAVDGFKESIGDSFIAALSVLPQDFLNVAMGVSEVGASVASVSQPIANFAVTLQALKVGGIGAGITAAFAGIKAAAMGLGAVIAAPFAAAIAVVGTTVAAIVGLGVAIAVLIKAVQVLGPTAAKTFAKLIAIIGVVGVIINQKLGQAFVEVVKLWGRNLDTVGNYVKRTFDSIVRWASGMVTSVSSWFGRLADGVKGVGRAIVEGLYNGIKDGWAWLEDQVASLVDDLVDSVTKGTSGGKSGSSSGSKGTSGGKSTSATTGGIADILMPGVSSAAALLPGKGSSSAGPTIVLNYSPAVSFGDQAEAASKLVPYITEAMRRVRL